MTRRTGIALTQHGESTLEPYGVGIIGCGNISGAYLSLLPKMRGVEVRAVADINHSAATGRAREFGLRSETMDGLLASGDIEAVVNLTVPDAHFEVSKSILLAGKHVYSEKPLALTLDDGKKLRFIAETAGRRVGSAPDTWMGGSHQAARAAIDDGRIGRVSGGIAHILSHGMEHWHPAPEFFYRAGGGPVLDVGPYYVSNLLQLLGPVSHVAAFATTPVRKRTISAGPRAGAAISVETPTHIQSLLHFRSGAVVALSASWNVWAHRAPNMELYGTEGSLFLPDPNFFGGGVEIAGRDGTVTALDFEHALSVPNQQHGARSQANYRSIGLAEMVQAIREDRPHRCSLELALHAVDVMTGILNSGANGTFVQMTTSCERPAAFEDRDARALLR